MGEDLKITQEEAEIKFLFKYRNVRRRSIVQLVRYWYRHKKPEKIFILAALCNDLRATMVTMDQDNRNWPKHIREIRGIVYFIARDLPKECNGSEEIVQEWLDSRIKETPHNELIY